MAAPCTFKCGDCNLVTLAKYGNQKRSAKPCTPTPLCCTHTPALAAHLCCTPRCTHTHTHTPPRAPRWICARLLLKKHKLEKTQVSWVRAPRPPMRARLPLTPGLRGTSRRCSHGGRLSVTAVGHLLGASRRSASTTAEGRRRRCNYVADPRCTLPCTCSQKKPTTMPNNSGNRGHAGQLSVSHGSTEPPRGQRAP